jgi:putative transcriptional regulator
LKNFVEQEREKKGLTREELAKLVDVSRQTIYFLETGKYNPSLQLAYKLAQVFNCLIEDLFIFDK